MKHMHIISAGLAAAMLFTLTACQTEQTPPDGSGTPVPGAVAGVAVQVQEVTVDTISTGNNVSGRVVSDSGQESVFVSAQAQCTAVYVKEGDSIRAGRKICTLDMASTISSYNAANISYTSALQSYQDQEAIFDAQISLAEKNVSDLRALLEIGAAAQVEIDQAELNLQTLQATKTSTLAQLEAGMQSYKSNVEQLTAVLENVDPAGNVIAPISGTILALNVAEGSYAGPTAPVAVIDGVSRMEISVSVSEALIPKLKTRDEVDVTIGALDTSFVGVIREIEDKSNPQTKLYDVTIGVSEDVDGLRVGMSADVSFRTDVSTDVIVIPTEAILTSNDEQYVFVVEDGQDSGKARYVPVETGLAGNGVTEVTQGLNAGDLLVIVGQAYLTDGAPVRIVSGEG